MKELRDAIESAVKEDVSTATEPTGTIDAAPIQESETHVESEHVEVTGSAEPVAVSESDNGEEEAPAAPDKVETEKPAAFTKAPASWKGDAKQVWDALPEQARREVVRREKQVNQVLQETATARQAYTALQQTTQKYGEKFQQWNAHPIQALEQFMEADRNLSSGPMENRAAYMARLIKEYAIDINALDSALAGTAPAPQVDMMSQVEALVNQRLAPIQQRLQAEEQAQTQQIAQTIRAMENNPKYPHFEDVREEMADLIEINFSRGVTLSLDDAYNKIVGYKGLAQPQARAQDTQRALNASVSVGGAPSSALNSGNPVDLRGTILKALEGGRA